MGHDPNRKLVEAYYLLQEAQRLVSGGRLPYVAKLLDEAHTGLEGYLDAIGAEGQEGLHEAPRPLGILEAKHTVVGELLRRHKVELLRD
jgi:hypothetical protein